MILLQSRLFQEELEYQLPSFLVRFYSFNNSLFASGIHIIIISFIGIVIIMLVLNTIHCIVNRKLNLKIWTRTMLRQQLRRKRSEVWKTTSTTWRNRYYQCKLQNDSQGQRTHWLRRTRQCTSRKQSYSSFRSESPSKGTFNIGSNNHDREQNMNKMHSTMIAALKQESAKRSEIPRELEITNAMYKKELAEAKEKYQEDIKSFQNKIKELELAKAEAESNLKQVATKSALVEREWKLKFEETMGKCKALEWKIKQNEEERKKQSEIAALDAQVKLSNKSVELEKVKAEHQRELDNIKNKCDNALKEIASLHKQEKDSLETRWEEAQAELKQSKLRYLEEIHELNAELTDTKQKAKYLEEQAQNFKGLKQRLYKAKQLLEVSEEMKTELKKARKQIVEMKAYIIKLESNEKRLKGSVSEKVTELEETRVSLKRRLSTERKRMQEDFNQERIQIMKELASKGREVDELSRRLKKSREKVDQHMDEVKRVVPELSNQHVFYRFGKDETMNAPRAFESNNNKVEYKQLKEYFAYIIVSIQVRANGGLSKPHGMPQLQKIDEY
eukprot:TRINITY_DN2404_c0_g1_i1.p2 TRINITY_DN2404_c0_g1~~TRINITY_DN2404_c0_g1_i1.p2  ORF type:complete len:559 (-),score=63.29 TRINITY_DN2404_c0_g1_i1:1806-3482(-)